MQEDVLENLKEFDALFDTKAAWPLIRTMLSTNVGYVLNSNRGKTKVTFIESPNGATFITADQPLINLCAFQNSGGEQTAVTTSLSDLKFYFPLTPNLAMTLDPFAGQGVDEVVASESQLDQLNRYMATASHEQLYAANEESLEAIDSDIV